MAIWGIFEFSYFVKISANSSSKGAPGAARSGTNMPQTWLIAA